MDETEPMSISDKKKKKTINNKGANAYVLCCCDMVVCSSCLVRVVMSQCLHAYVCMCTEWYESGRYV